MGLPAELNRIIFSNDISDCSTDWYIQQERRNAILVALKWARDTGAGHFALTTVITELERKAK